MSGAPLGYSERGRLRISVTLTGLAANEAVALDADGAFIINWVCGVEPESCGELGCAPTYTAETEGTVRESADGVAGADGVATVDVEMVAVPPAETCPTDATAQWQTRAESWKRINVTDAVRGLRLTPGPVEWWDTY